jgi:3-methyl-2-oxobutanoate hydroxymethyltransferase
MAMYHKRKTIADLRALKGKHQMAMLYVETHDEARAAAAAGIEMLSISINVWTEAMREAAGDCVVQVGMLPGEFCTFEDYLRGAHRAIMIGADCIYCIASIETIRKLASEGIPIVGHVGLVPLKATWTGGFRAVGKDATSAQKIFDAVMELEKAGAIGAEIEVVPARVASEISKRTKLILLSMGAGAGCDAQYLFAEDILGYTRNHMPRHAKAYRNFRLEFERLQNERIAAFREYKNDVDAGHYPEEKHLVSISDAELKFTSKLP